MISLVFPGQGSQMIGMGKELYNYSNAARDVFNEVDNTLKTKLSKLMFEGDFDTLTLTENVQPAIMTVSIAVIRTIEEKFGFKISERVKYVAGHSLGEYTALCATNALTLCETAKLLRARGKAMQNAVPVGKGGMLALLGITLETAQEIAEEALKQNIKGVCEIANDNGCGQIVLSGTVGTINSAIILAQKMQVKKIIRLPVSAPFHCSLMKSAQNVMSDYLNTVHIKTPSVPLISNISASEVTDPHQIKKLLMDQITNTVRWREIMLFLSHKKIKNYIEIGVGKTLANLMKRIDKDMNTYSINLPDDIEEFAHLFK